MRAPSILFHQYGNTVPEDQDPANPALFLPLCLKQVIRVQFHFSISLLNDMRTHSNDQFQLEMHFIPFILNDTMDNFVYISCF